MEEPQQQQQQQPPPAEQPTPPPKEQEVGMGQSTGDHCLPPPRRKAGLQTPRGMASRHLHTSTGRSCS